MAGVCAKAAQAEHATKVSKAERGRSVWAVQEE